MAGRPRLAWASLGFGLAALASAWNPAAAPFGLAVGLGAAVLAIRALRAGGGRRAALLGLAAAVVAVGVAVLVLALAAGLGRQGGEAALVPAPTPRQADEALDAGASATRAARERAREELEGLPPPAKQAPSN